MEHIPNNNKEYKKSEFSIISDYRSKIGEGPLWHPLEQVLYWVDIPCKKVFRFDPGTLSCETIYEGEPIHGLTVQQDGTLLLYMQNGMVANLQKGVAHVILDVRSNSGGVAFNDVIADPLGRVFWGSVPSDLGSVKKECGLYRIDTDGVVNQVADDIGVSNGLGFSPDQTILYHTDTMVRKIYTYDYHKESGNLSNRKVFAEFGENEGEPDGMTVDKDGYVWTCLWGSGTILRISPSGKKEYKIIVPASKPSSVCFGGDTYTDMYVTSAIDGPPFPDMSTAAGAVFRIKGSIAGNPEYLSKIQLTSRK